MLLFLTPLSSQIDRTKKPSVRVSDGVKPSQNGTAKDRHPTQNGPVVPDRSAKPPFNPSGSQSEEEQSQIHPEAAAVVENRAQEERQEKEQREKEAKERLEREERERKEEEEKGHQERKRLERQRAEEEEVEKENGAGKVKDNGGKEQSAETPTKSASLDSPAPIRIVSEIKVSFSPDSRLPQQQKFHFI